MLFVGTTDASGNLTITQRIYRPRRVTKVEWFVGEFAAGVDATLIAVGAGNVVGSALVLANRTLLTLTDANVNAWYPINESGGGVVENLLRLSVTNGGANKAGGCRVYLEDSATASILDTGTPLVISGSTTITGITKPTVLLFARKVVTTAGTRVPLVATSTPLVGGYVEITALSTNTGIIYVGDVTVASTNGHRLAAGVSTVIFIDDLNRLYLDASVSGEGVTYQGS